MKIWKPLLTQPESSGVDQKIEKIAHALEEVYPLTEQSGLFGGKAGSALFFFYYGKFTGDLRFFELGNQILEDIFFDINRTNFHYSMADGLAGIAWTIEHLVSAEFIHEEYLFEISKLDSFLSKTMVDEMKSGNYDHLHGSLGIANYLLKGVERKNNRAKIEETIHLLKQSAVISDGSIYWPSIIDHENNISGFNLGLSHGLASILYFLLNAYKKDILPGDVLNLLEGSIQYLISIKEQSSNTRSIYPNWLMDGNHSGESRLAWCYGDPGIGMILWQSGKILKNSRIEEISKDVLYHSTSRRELKINGVYDASICHGSAGLVQIYNRLFRDSGDQRFYEAAKYWLGVTVDLGQEENGIAGFIYRNPTKPEGWVRSTGFLEGIAGIGLVLISALSDINPDWDECLMLS